MKESHADAFIRVYDDVLPEAVFHELWRLMNALPYQSTAAKVWAKVWNIGDGHILRAKQHLTDELGMPRSGTVVDELIDRVREIAATHPALMGFTGLAVIPYVWPQATGISWHSDGAAMQAEHRVGGFTFYAHKEGNAEWGGEFLLYPESGVGGEELPFDNSEVSNQILSRGVGTWVAPRPNRLLVITGDALHKVAKTTPFAAPRVTIQGFVFRQVGVGLPE
jgi:hypothetical protein